ncbi:DUF1641 domain-containing protein [Domibacillus mangrovi]|uniref:DUF1641 domain-containing protein n=1 Tax=Domibacillus mangrovi TaxID=1714354 RepID=A0A1Q5P5D3_9BACI|nr:DUF1641 domain-containing protein [Domibacillus mangrovi]OKL37466.1 hypothetical protein BLL40_03925 [Domibacillus mangrovi]
MAKPITSIVKTEVTPEQKRQNSLEELQTLLTEHDDALNKIITIIGDLHAIGVLDAASSMLQAKEDITKIALDQVAREPVTNLINHAMNASGALASIDPDVTAKLAGSVQSGLKAAEQQMEKDEKINILSLLKLINDPDINRAVRFGIHFLKGMGKELEK